jgi:hypothetical protein
MRSVILRMMRRWACQFVVTSSLCVARVAAAGPLDKPAFSATPSELLAEGKAVGTDGADVVVLRDDVAIQYDAAGRAETRYHSVFVVLRASAIDDWGNYRATWSPFYQDKPTLRVRVISAAGAVADNDPSLITDAPSVSESPSVYSDRRDLAHRSRDSRSARSSKRS